MPTLLERKLANTIIDNYQKYVVKSGLKLLQEHKQYGIREGTTLAEHFTNGGFTIYTLKNAVGLSDIETQLLMSAFSIHDLNKLSEYPNASLGKLADDENFVKENISKLGVDKFFKEWEEYYNDIISIRAHSGHFHIAGEQLIPAKDKTKLGYDRIRELSHIMKAVDIIDLSKEFSERKKKEEFLHHINSASKIQFRWINHKLTEHRGVLSNIIHNQVVEVLKNHEALPLLVYSEGTWYLLPNSVDFPPLEKLLEEVSQEVDTKLAKVRIEDSSKLVKQSPNAGIKVEKSLVGLLSAKDMIKLIQKEIYAKKPDIKKQLDRTKKETQKVKLDLEKYLKEKGLKNITTEEDEDFIVV